MEKSDYDNCMAELKVSRNQAAERARKFNEDIQRAETVSLTREEKVKKLPFIPVTYKKDTYFELIKTEKDISKKEAVKLMKEENESVLMEQYAREQDYVYPDEHVYIYGN